MNISSYILSKRYTDNNIVETRQFVEDTVVGGGAIKGAPCKIDSIEKVEGGNLVTFIWKLDDETERSESLFIKDGEGGKDGATPLIGDNGHWFIGGVDTGVVAAPDLAGFYNEDNFLPLTDEEIDQLCSDEEV
jgi:hypothetical protein